MSRLKNISRAGWLVTGIVIAFLLVPTAVAAKAPKLAGIILGTSGNKADVTPASQLLVAEASPSNFYSNATTVPPTASLVVASPPAGDAVIVKTIHVAWQAATPGNAFLNLFVSNPSCSVDIAIIDSVTPATASGNWAFDYEPGFTIPSGDALCSTAVNFQSDEVVTVYGYNVPSAAAPSFAAPRL